MSETLGINEDRLATTDQHGRRVFVYPADVQGKWKTLRSKVQVALILFFLILPWIHVNGKQWFLLDVAHRRFEIFGLSLRAHDAPALVLVFATFAFGIFLATAAFGRVWCGWACPQTVFIDGVFRWIERLTEGAALSRRQLAQAPWTTKKLRIKATKWALYILAAGVVTHSFLAYFNGSSELIEMVQSDPRENWASFLFILATTSLVLWNFTWFREQFCIIVCPYGRFQSAYMDPHTKVVGYDARRGEPRRSRDRQNDSRQGDCVDCLRCVQVCPTGIDIRRGTQLECIACTACIDACDDVMTKIKKPPGLIRYTSERELSGEPIRRFRPRVVILSLLLGLSAVSLALFVLLHSPLEIAWLRAKGSPYEVIKSDGQPDVVVNRFVMEVSNQKDMSRTIEVRRAEENNHKDTLVIMAVNPTTLEPGVLKRLDLFVRAPRAAFQAGTAKAFIEVKDFTTGEVRKKELTLVGPIF